MGRRLSKNKVKSFSLRRFRDYINARVAFINVDKVFVSMGVGFINVLSTLTVVNVSRNGRGALYKPLKLLTLKTRKMHLNRPFKVLHSLHLLTDKPYMQ